MSSQFRSASVGAVPHKKPLARSRAQSSQPVPLEVRCACQFFQSDSLIPERINPIGSRPASRAGEIEKPLNCSKVNILESTVEEENLSGSVLSFGKTSVPDYYADTNASSYQLDGNEENFRQFPNQFSQGSLNQFPQSGQFTQGGFNQLSQQGGFNQLSQRGFDQASQRNFDQASQREFPPTTANHFTPSTHFSHASQPLTFDDRSIPSIEVESYRRDYPIMNLSQQNESLKGTFSSQKSLDRYSTSGLLNKYRPKSQSVAPSLQGSAVDIRSAARMTKTVSFDYGQPTHRRTSQSSDNPNFDQYHRMSPMVFPIRDRLQKLRDNR